MLLCPFSVGRPSQPRAASVPARLGVLGSCDVRSVALAPPVVGPFALGRPVAEASTHLPAVQLGANLGARGLALCLLLPGSRHHVVRAARGILALRRFPGSNTVLRPVSGLGVPGELGRAGRSGTSVCGTTARCSETVWYGYDFYLSVLTTSLLSTWRIYFLSSESSFAVAGGAKWGWGLRFFERDRRTLVE